MLFITPISYRLVDETWENGVTTTLFLIYFKKALPSNDKPIEGEKRDMQY